MSKGIPEHVDFIRAAKACGVYQGNYDIARMRRLVDYLADRHGQVSVDVTFGRNETKRYFFLKGTAAGRFSIPCQRCLEPMQQDIEVSFELGLVEEEHYIKRLPEEVDPYLIKAVPDSLMGVIEDELILSFPSVVMHEQDQCNATQYMKVNEGHSVTEQDEGKGNNPFAALESLKKELD